MTFLDTKTQQYGRILVALYLLSGFTSLAYEILWTRMLSLQFGVSIFGVVATVTAFMGGLGAGSLFGTRWSRAVASPLRLFAVLEISVAVSALLVPQLFQIAQGSLNSIAASTSLAAWHAIQFILVVLVLMLPAFAMGAGFPLILSAVSHARVSLGGIYGINALGGALGALAPLLLLPALGWLAAIQTIAIAGLVVGGGALWLSMTMISSRCKSSASDEFALPPTRWLLAYAGIGAAALILEIGWTRLFGMVLLRTEYVLAIILAIFLIGIAFGSLAARYLNHPRWLTVLPIFACLFAILSLWLLPAMSAWVEASRFDSLGTALFQQGSTIATMTLPVTLVLGAWLPLLSAKIGDRYHSGAWLYGANSLGAALGALLAGFVLIPNLGTSITIFSAAILLLVLGLTWSRSRVAWISLPILGLLAIPVLTMPPVSVLLPQGYAQTTDIFFHEDAISITHVVEQADGQRQLLADLHRMDASSEPAAVAVQKNQARLPLLLHPKPEKVLFLGLGTAITAAGSLPFPGIDGTAVELSQGSIAAATKYFSEVNGGVSEKLNIVRDDARHFLLSSDKTYDVIVGDLFHPDLAGRSALLSRQQFQRARDRLGEGGIFVQWLALNQFDLESLRIVLRTFRDVFPDGVIFVDAFRLAMVGGRDANLQAASMLANLARLDDEQNVQATGGEGPWTWLGRYWGRIPRDEGQMQDEWAPVIEYRLPGARYNGELDLSRLLGWLLAQRPHLNAAAQELRVDEKSFTDFERAYAATDLAYRSWVALLTKQDAQGQRLLPLAYQANPKDRWIGFAIADGLFADPSAAKERGMSEQQLMETVLRVRPDHTDAIRALWKLEQAAGNSFKAEQYRARLAELSPLDKGLKRIAIGDSIEP
jgi:spermidine synthase